MSRKLAILGAGGHGRVVADAAEAAGWDDVRFFDDRGTHAGSMAAWPVVGTTQDLLDGHSSFDGVIVAIGSNPVRRDLTRRLVEAGAAVAGVIHPRSVVSPHSRLGAGVVVLAGAVINVGTTLGDAVIVNTGATVDHDCTIADGVHIAPGAHLAGGISVGEESWIGVGSTVRENLAIGRNVCIGAGAVVVKSIGDDVTMVGNPARPLNR